MCKATIELSQHNYQHKIYDSITETKFEQSFADHTNSFRYEIYQSDPELSNELRSIKNNLSQSECNTEDPKRGATI